MNVNEIMKNNEGKFNSWEIYSWNNKRHIIHTDYVDDLENSEIAGRAPVTYKASAVDTWELMDKDDYANTILANQGISIDEIDDEDFPVLVMVLEDHDEYFHVFDVRETEIYSDEYQSLDEANEAAKIEWNHLTKLEQKRAHIYVGISDVRGGSESDVMRTGWDSEEQDHYTVDYNTGAGNFEFRGDLEKAQAAADEEAAYTGQPIIIYDSQGNEVSRREWYGVKYNPDEAEAISPIEFGDYGYYADWTE